MTEDYTEINILKDRYLIGDYLESGSNAVLYNLMDLKNTQTPLVIKLSQDIENFANEIMITKIIYHMIDGEGKNIEIVDDGLIERHGYLWAYLIMPKM